MTHIDETPEVLKTRAWLSRMRRCGEDFMWRGAEQASATFETLLTELKEVREALTFDEPDAFEAWWQNYRHKNRDLATYPIKKQIAFDGFHQALEQARSRITTKGEVDRDD